MSMIIRQKYTFEGLARYNGIYGTKDPRNLCEYRYVGKTTRGDVRYREHSNLENLKDKNHKNYWFKSLLLDDIKPHFVLLELVDPSLGDDGLDIAEIRWIAELKADGHRLTNSTEGGGGQSGIKRARGHKRTEESKRKQSEKMSGSKHPFWGQPRDPESVKKMSISKMGDKNPRFGVSSSVSTRRKVAKGRGIVPFLDETGNIYYTQREAASILSLLSQNIGQVLLGNREHTGGHTFRYLTTEDIARLESKNA